MPFLLKSVGLLVVYLIAAQLGLEFGQVQGVRIVWPPNGIALAMVLLAGPRYFGAIGLAAWLAAQLAGMPPWVAAALALGQVLETALAYTLLTRYLPCQLALMRVKDLLSIVLVGGGLASAVNAVLSPLSLLAAGLITTAMLPNSIWHTWGADMLGVAFFTPLLLLFVNRRKYLSARVSWPEACTLLVSATLAGLMVLLGWLPAGLILDRPAQLAWLFPFVFWAGLRTGRRNSALLQMLFLSLAMTSAHLGQGFFADQFRSYGLANFWFGSMALATGPLLLAIYTRERWLEALQISLHAKLFTLSNDAVVICDASDHIISVNPAFTSITGYTLEELKGQRPCVYASGLHDQAFYTVMWDQLLCTDQWDGEIWNRRKSGELFLEKLSIRTIKDSDGLVVNRLGIFSDVTESRAAQEAVKHQAQHDFLTNLPNRLLFTDRFGQQLAQARRNNSKFAVIYLDLDGFKAVNDRLGHATGDQLLVAVAQRLTSLVREIDTVSRLGGDEFAVLMCDVSHNSDVTTLADKMLSTLGQPYVLNLHTVDVTASLGLAIYPYHGQDMDTLVNAADEALRQTKIEGKNGWQISDIHPTQPPPVETPVNYPLPG